jgi:transposase
LFAALEVATGTVLGECRPRHTGADFLTFLKRLARAYRGREVHVILDNSSSHTTPAVQTWLTTHPRGHFHFTPTGASWLNMVEAWFSVLTRKSVRRGSFDTVRALIRHISRYIAEWNAHPTPFIWTKEPSRKLSGGVVNMTSRRAIVKSCGLSEIRRRPSWSSAMAAVPRAYRP